MRYLRVIGVAVLAACPAVACIAHAHTPTSGPIFLVFFVVLMLFLIGALVLGSWTLGGALAGALFGDVAAITAHGNARDAIILLAAIGGAFWGYRTDVKNWNQPP